MFVTRNCCSKSNERLRMFQMIYENIHMSAATCKVCFVFDAHSLFGMRVIPFWEQSPTRNFQCSGGVGSIWRLTIIEIRRSFGKPPRFSTLALGMTICPKHVQNMSGMCLKHDQNMFETCLTHVWNMTNSSHVSNMSDPCLKHYQMMSEACMHT